MPIKIAYACPVCKLLGDPDSEVNVEPLKSLTYKKKKRGGLYTKYKIGICNGCGILYTYEVVDKLPGEDAVEDCGDD